MNNLVHYFKMACKWWPNSGGVLVVSMASSNCGINIMYGVGKKEIAFDYCLPCKKDTYYNYYRKQAC